MANLKISQLTATTQNTIGSWVVINNSGETTSNKSQLEYVLGLTKGSGISSMKSADFLTDIPSVASSNYSIVLGNAASGTTAPSQVVIGNGAYSVSEGTVVIGKNAHDQGTGRDHGIAIGTDAEIYQPRAISIGKNSGAVTDAISIGTDGRAIANTSIAIGASTVVAGDFGVGIGYDIFQDRTNATVIGTSSYVSGADSTVVGAQSKLGQTGGDSERSTIVGVSNDIQGPNDNMVAIGYDNTLTGQGSVSIGSNFTIAAPFGIGIGGSGDSALGSASDYSVIIGGSGNTYASEIGVGNISIGSFNNSSPYPSTRNVLIGGSGNTINSVGGVCRNNVALGLLGRSIASSLTDTTLVENFINFGTYLSAYETITATTVTLDVSIQDHFNIVATNSASTYNIVVNPIYDGNIGREITLYIEYVSGATINFNAFGSGTWKWDQNFAGNPPTFSATTGNTSRTILKFASWDNDDWYEVSRSVNME
jgi:hypothetical protein